MKKFLALLLTVMMVMTMAACGSDASTDNGGTNENSDFVRGVWTDNVYSNEFLNLTFTMPEDWAYASDEEIAEQMGLAAEYASSTTEYAKAYADTKNIYDMISQNQVNGSDVIVMAENLALTVGGTAYDEQAYLDAVSEQLLQQDSLDYSIEGETQDVTLGGETYKMLTTNLYEGELNQCYLVRRVGKYMEAIIVTYLPSVIDQQALLDLFGSVQ